MSKDETYDKKFENIYLKHIYGYLGPNEGGKGDRWQRSALRKRLRIYYSFLAHHHDDLLDEGFVRAFEELKQELQPCTEEELLQAWKGGRHPLNPEWSLTQVFFKKWKSRVIDACRALKSRVLTTAEHQDDDHPEKELLERSDTESHERITRLEYRDLLRKWEEFFCVVSENDKFYNFGGVALSHSSIQSAIIISRAQPLPGSTKEDRIAELLEVTQGRSEEFRNAIRYQEKLLIQMQRDFLAWTVYLPLYVKYKDALWGTKSLLSYFKLVECMKLNERRARPVLGRILGWPEEDDKQQIYISVQESYLDTKADFVARSADLHRMREHLLEIKPDSYVNDRNGPVRTLWARVSWPEDPFDYPYAMKHFSLRTEWPDYLKGL